MKNRIPGRRTALIGLVALVAMAIVEFEFVDDAQAASTQTYCLQGGSTNTEFYIQLYSYNFTTGVSTNLTLPGSTYVTVAAAPVSGNTSGINANIRAAINGAGVAGLSAVNDFTDPNCPGWDTAFTVNWTGANTFYMRVGGNPIGIDCNVSYEPSGGICTVNPQIVLASGPPPPSSPPAAGILTAGDFAKLALALLMLGAIFWTLRGRRGAWA